MIMQALPEQKSYLPPHEEPSYEDGTPAYFTDLHNQYLERLYDIAPGEIARIYTSSQFGLGRVVEEGTAAIGRYLQHQRVQRAHQRDVRGTGDSTSPSKKASVPLKRGVAVRKDSDEGKKARNAILKRLVQQRIKTRSTASSGTSPLKSQNDSNNPRSGSLQPSAFPVIRPAKGTRKPEVHSAPQDARYRTRSGRVLRARSQTATIEED